MSHFFYIIVAYLRMIKSNQNVARPEGYSVSEKMLSWSRMGWWHMGLFAFVILSIVAVGSTWSSLDHLMRNRIDTLFVNEQVEAVVTHYEAWVTLYAGFFTVFPLIGVGYLVDRLVGGRFVVFISLLFFALVMVILFLTIPSSKALAALVYPMLNFFALPAIYAMGYLFCYEFVPLKHRLVAILSLSCAETFGRLVTGLIDNLTAREGEKGNSSQVWERRTLTYMVFSIVLISVTILIGLIFVGRNTPLGCVSCDKKPGLAYDQLLSEGVKNTSEPIPMSRDEFEINTEKDIAALGEANYIFGSIKRCFLGPIAVMIGAAFIDAVIEQVFHVFYYSYAQNYLGKGYEKDYLPMMMIDNGVALGGILASIGLYIWMKDIRFVPPTALLIATLGAVICASVNVVNQDDGFPVDMNVVEPSIRRLTTGVVMFLLARHVYKTSFRVLSMDLFPTSCRGRGVFVYKAIETFLISVVASITLELKTTRSFWIIIAIIAAGIGALIFAVFYTTSWFEKSLICQDPELDANWLINHSELNTVIGSRDKEPSKNTTTASSTGGSLRF